MIKKMIKFIVINIYCSIYVFGADSWENDYNSFVASKLIDLRKTRSEVKRPCFSFELAVDVLDLIETGKNTYGVSIIAASGPPVKEGAMSRHITRVYSLSELFYDWC